jgi:hypothetical protein
MKKVFRPSSALYPSCLLVFLISSLCSARLYEDAIKAYKSFDMGGGITCGVTKSFYDIAKDSAKAEETATDFLKFYQQSSGMLKWSNIILDMQVEPATEVTEIIKINGKDTTLKSLKLKYIIGMYVVDPIILTNAISFENQRQEILFDRGRYVGTFALRIVTGMCGENIFNGYVLGRICQINASVDSKIKAKNEFGYRTFISLAKNMNVQAIFALCDEKWTPLYKMDAVTQKIVDQAKAYK